MSEKEEKNRELRKLERIKGLSIRQIARIIGFAVNIVGRAL